MASGSSASGPSVPRDALRGVVASPAVGYFAPRAGNISIGSTLRSGDTVRVDVDVLGVRQEAVSLIDGALRAFEVEVRSGGRVRPADRSR